MATITTKVVRRTRKLGATVLTRRQWGNTSTVYAKRRFTHPHKLLPKQPSDTTIQHISVTWDSIDFARCMRNLHEIGMSRFGSGVSYQFCISMGTGKIGLGNALDAKGTHTVNRKKVPHFSYDQNAVGVGIAFVGMPGDKLSPEAIKATQRLIAAMILEGAMRKGFDYVPHSMFAAKDCPTDEVRKHMSEILSGAMRIVRQEQN